MNVPLRDQSTLPNNEWLPSLKEIFKSERTGIKYELLDIISKGGFGTVFTSKIENSGIKVALKIEKWDNSMQAIEVFVLKTARAKSCNHFPDLYDYGIIPKKFNFMALTLLGKDLYCLRKEQQAGKFTLSTALRIGIQTMQAIEELHSKCFFICRDIKPSNFVIGLPNTTNKDLIYMIDFGLCRRYVQKVFYLKKIIIFFFSNNNIIPSRGVVGWRGTYRYGSLQCHLRMDLGRKDDIESWYYMLVESTTGTVPWQQIRDREHVHSMKILVRTTEKLNFLKNCPKQYEELMKKIDEMVFSDKPDYLFFYTTLAEICVKNNIQMNDRFDWTPPPTIESVGNTSQHIKTEETSTQSPTGINNEATTDEDTTNTPY